MLMGGIVARDHAVRDLRSGLLAPRLLIQLVSSVAPCPVRQLVTLLDAR